MSIVEQSTISDTDIDRSQEKAGQQDRITTNELFIRRFSFRHLEVGMSAKEIQLLNAERRACDASAELYAAQQDENFYPERMSTEEFEEAAENNPDIKSPYTYVRRKKNGELAAIPTHEFFAEQIKISGIVEALREASSIANSPGMRDALLSAYLRSRANAFLTGSWEESDRLWLELDEIPKNFIVIGLYDRNLDVQRSLKFAFQSWAANLNEQKTQEAEDYTRKILETIAVSRGVEIPRVRVRAEETFTIAGQAAQKKWTANSNPPQENLREELGSVIHIFEPALSDKFRLEVLPAYKRIIHPSKRATLPVDSIELANKKLLLGHEAEHSFPSKDAPTRLGGHALWVTELDCELSSLDTNLELAKTKREKDALIAAFFANGLVEHDEYQDDQARFEYFLGACIAQNYLILKGSTISVDGTLDWNTKRVARSVKKIASDVRYIKSSGNRKEARQFSNQFFSDETYRNLKPESQLPYYLRLDS